LIAGVQELTEAQGVPPAKVQPATPQGLDRETLVTEAHVFFSGCLSMSGLRSVPPMGETPRLSPEQTDDSVWCAPNQNPVNRHNLERVPRLIPMKSASTSDTHNTQTTSKNALNKPLLSQDCFPLHNLPFTKLKHSIPEERFLFFLNGSIFSEEGG
jgi:hypothetical protein